MCTRAVFSFTPVNADAFDKTSSQMINVVLMHTPLRVCIEMANASIGKAIQRVLQLCADRPHCSTTPLLRVGVHHEQEHAGRHDVHAVHALLKKSAEVSAVER